ncbi:MAG: tRNA epoxyqueuosine(34) reductase QueG [Pirellulales bacterium]|nr:tRNA epoxyqueuosine(34) reductase QueG [Pirellulales bacterium]
MSPDDLTRSLKQEARRLGFDLVGVTRAAEPSGFGRLEDWLASGHAGRMRYLADRREAYRHPRHVLDGVRSLLMLGVGYRSAEPVPIEPGQGRISRYAWGLDYHELIHARLKRLVAFHRRLVPEAVVRGVVDTAPLLEREFAQRAGLGWIGKNTMLINPKLGSWVFLAALLSGEALDVDSPSAESHCGSCRACLDACPTGALIEPYRLDARRCISYLTIELRESIDEPLRESIGERLFGCDACQEACPWNRHAPATREEAFAPRDGENPVDLGEWFALDDEAFRDRFRHTPLWRARRRGLLRNAAIVLGNTRPAPPGAEAALRQGLRDEDPMVREACSWALARHEA